MKISWIAFAIVTLLAVATIFWIPLIQREIPEIPGNSVHISVINVSECIGCHIIAIKHLLPSDHPAQDKCLYCHKMKEI
ncbi:MAG: hypothetical protein IT392_02965 [Nitrospirae bacterium]|nr:hypothetical protein [Nitrospirota bacterium]